MMPDREKVKYDIERCICHVPDACRDCSHYGHGEVIGCMEELLTDALALLKEEEAELQKGRYYSDVFDIGYKAGKESLVRCKDCKHHDRCEISEGCKDDLDWFCADGERREI